MECDRSIVSSNVYLRVLNRDLASIFCTNVGKVFNELRHL